MPPEQIDNSLTSTPLPHGVFKEMFKICDPIKYIEAMRPLREFEPHAAGAITELIRRHLRNPGLKRQRSEDDAAVQRLIQSRTKQVCSNSLSFPSGGTRFGKRFPNAAGAK